MLTTVSQDSLQNKSSSVQNLQLEACGTKELLHVDVMELHLSGCVVRMTVETSDHDQVIRTEKLNSIVSQLCSSNQENHQRENSGDVTTQCDNSVNSLSLTSDPELQQSPLNMHVEWHKDELKVWIGFNQQDAKALAVAEQLLRWIALHFPLTSIVCNGKEIYDKK